MKKLALLIFLIAAVIPSGMKVLGITETQVDTISAIQGSWMHRGFYYVFKDSVMTAAHLSGEPKGFKTFHYTVQEMGAIQLIRYGKNLSDSRDNGFLLVDSVTDSTAVFAYPTIFIRSDSSSGFTGEWKHSKDLRSIQISVGSGTIDYREMSVDAVTGALVTETVRHGFYRPGKGKNTGRFLISYDDGASVTVVPVIFGDVMYFFDISPRKSMFLRSDYEPTFRDYQQLRGGT